MSRKNVCILLIGSILAVGCTTMKAKEDPSRLPQSSLKGNGGIGTGGVGTFNNVSDYSASCVRSDSGDSPEMIIYSSDALTEGYVVLTDGSEEVSRSLIVPVAIESTDVVHRLSGAISGVIETQGDSEYRSETSFKFDLNYPKLRSWLKDNANWSQNGDSIAASFKCRN